MKAEHWPGGKPPRQWAAEVAQGGVRLEDVPAALREWVRYYVTGQSAGDQRRASKA